MACIRPTLNHRRKLLHLPLIKSSHELSFIMSKSTRTDKSARKFAPLHARKPGSQEVEALVALFSRGRYAEAATHAQAMTVHYPLHGFGWMMLGVVSSQMGRNTDALVPMQKAAALSPGDAGVHSNLGNIFQSLGRLNEAEASYRRALQIKPDFAEAYNNLGKALHGLGRTEEADTSYRRALQLRPDFAEAHSNMGNNFLSMGRLNEAEMSYKRALEIKPNDFETHNNMGVALLSMNRLDEAEACYRRALSINPDYADAYGNLGGVLSRNGNPDAALACFQQQVRLAPDNGEAQHLIASLSGKNTERAPDQYVESVFDGYAHKFDTHLQQVLEYNAPQKLVSLVTQHSAVPGEKWNVLDLGCGTGLVGSAIAPFARQLVGVDLSTKMLEKARARNLYQRLERLDLLTMLRAEKSSSYDVVIAADVFIYIGKLDEIVSETKRLLCPGGLFSFSIEALEPMSNAEAVQGVPREYQLNNTGRYSQSVSYVNRLAAASGFQVLDMVETQLRKEHGRAVNGYLVLWKS